MALALRQQGRLAQSREGCEESLIGRRLAWVGQVRDWNGNIAVADGNICCRFYRVLQPSVVTEQAARVWRLHGRTLHFGCHCSPGCSCLPSAFQSTHTAIMARVGNDGDRGQR